jgi:hypothetical protein
MAHEKLMHRGLDLEEEVLHREILAGAEGEGLREASRSMSRD